MVDIRRHIESYIEYRKRWQLYIEEKPPLVFLWNNLIHEFGVEKITRRWRKILRAAILQERKSIDFPPCRR